MNFFQVLSTLTAHAFSWMIMGAALACFLRLKESLVQWLLKAVIVRLALPLYIFCTVVKHLPVDRLGVLYQFGIAAVFLVFWSYCLSALCFRVFKLKIHKNSFLLGNSIHNYGFMAYAVVESLYGSSVLSQMFVLVVTMELILWTWGLKLLTDRKKVSSKIFLSPPLLALCAGLLWIVLIKTDFSSNVAGQAFVSLSKCAVPGALICLGAMLFHIMKKMGFGLVFDKAIWVCIFHRHFLVPVTLLMLVHLFIQGQDLKNILKIQAIMPMALMPMAMLSIYGGEHQRMGFAISLSNILSFVTIPIWLALLCVN